MKGHDERNGQKEQLLSMVGNPTHHVTPGGVLRVSSGRSTQLLDLALMRAFRAPNWVRFGFVFALRSTRHPLFSTTS